MADWDAVIIGGGPAGLTAGLYLCRGNWRTLLIEKASIGGNIVNIEFIENYPGHGEGVMGAELAQEMKQQAMKYGLEIQRNEVIAAQSSPRDKWVTCKDDSNLSTSVLVLAGGSVPRKLGVPGEEEFRGKGVFTCAFCDGSRYADKVIAVCGGGDAAVGEAAYMARIASKVFILCRSELRATSILRERVRENPKIEVYCGVRVDRITGGDTVEAIEYTDTRSGRMESLGVAGVLVHIGQDPCTGFLQGAVPLDEQGHVVVDQWMETEIPGIFAGGDIRRGSPQQIATAVGDGATAAIAAQRFLQKLKG